MTTIERRAVKIAQAMRREAPPGAARVLVGPALVYTDEKLMVMTVLGGAGKAGVIAGIELGAFLPEPAPKPRPPGGITKAEGDRFHAALVSNLRRRFAEVITCDDDVELARLNAEHFPSAKADQLFATVTAEHAAKPRPAEDAAHPPGQIRVTLVFEDGAGTSAFYNPAYLPTLITGIDRLPHPGGGTFRQKAATLEGWGRLREMAIANLPTDAESAMGMLLWCYFRHPNPNMKIAAHIQETLDSDGRATLTVVRNRQTKTTVGVVTETYAKGALELAEIRVPKGFAYASCPTAEQAHGNA